jgi:hypothetical protein
VFSTLLIGLFCAVQDIRHLSIAHLLMAIITPRSQTACFFRVCSRPHNSIITPLSLVYAGLEIIPAMQNGMGILSYLKYYRLTNQTEPQYLATAKLMAEYLISEANTANVGPWANTTRSSGFNWQWPLTASSQSDMWFGADCIEPDKVALAAYALFELFLTTGELEYYNQALHSAQVLVATQQPGNSTHAPWPFRVSAATGRAVDPTGARSGNMVFALRLFRALSTAGRPEFEGPAQALWEWISNYQLTADNSNRDTSLVSGHILSVCCSMSHGCPAPLCL